MTSLLKASDEAEFKRLTEAWYRRRCPDSAGAAAAADEAWKNTQDAGIAEKPLEEGWYWVRTYADSHWHPIHYDSNKWRFGVGHSQTPHEIGPRILPPDSSQGGV